MSTLSPEAISVFEPLEEYKNTYQDFDTPVEASFNWQAIYEQLLEEYPEIGNEVVLFVFRSIRKATANDELLDELDRGALDDAKNAAGFIH